MNQEQDFSAQHRQKEIYIAGIGGQKPTVPVDFNELRSQAESTLSRKAFAYAAGGAGQGKTISGNRRALDQLKIWPRILRDVSDRDTSIELLGQLYPSPFLLAPIGALELAHQDADLAVARAAACTGIPMIFSSQASHPMEDCAAMMGDSPRWFQLYWSKSNDLVKSFVQRAEQCDCSAIVVTLDTTMLGWRSQDLDLAHLPFLKGKGIAQYTSDPVFQALLDKTEESPTAEVKPKKNLQTLLHFLKLTAAFPGEENFLQKLRSQRPMKAVQQFIDIYSRPSLTWQDLAFLREQTQLPILLKGILHPDDARLAVEHGMNGVIVSNHGGRQVDSAVAAIAVLPDIVKAVDDQIPVIVDSGIRGGADMFKALALGAKVVLLGRPYVYGLALAGERGVVEVIKNLMADFELTMGLAGCKSVDEIGPEYLFV